ncbi:hypothetical protein NP493_94g05030 [Ridgeia piscesae]|uniref:Uncharacterized protein n=1 Tax=Ridgeia piscesae TaxID=27915 RepID=A0AAD9P842_RIDPI|nr:hypothetical protein NP493_94g05030 [Ridgeia piscesae]
MANYKNPVTIQQCNIINKVNCSFTEAQNPLTPREQPEKTVLKAHTPTTPPILSTKPAFTTHTRKRWNVRSHLNLKPTRFRPELHSSTPLKRCPVQGYNSAVRLNTL